MLILNAEVIRALAPMPLLIDCMREAFRKDWVAMERQISRVPGGTGARLLLSMPAFDLEGGGAVKLATVFPDNPAHQ